MDTGTLRPSIVWGDELLASTLWVLAAFTISAIVVLIALAVVARTTEWGSQFWRITGAYFTGRGSVTVWLLVAAMLLSTIIAVRINVLLSYYANDLFTALQLAFTGAGGGGDTAAGEQAFWSAMKVFVVLACVHTVRLLVDLYVTQRFIIRWRIWLSARFVDDWLGDYAYFRSQFSNRPIDNPDQRIQQDIDVFTTGVGAEPNNPSYSSSQTLLFGAVEAMVAVVSFGMILWELSGPLTLLDVTVPKALFWIVIVYVLVATVVAFLIGRPLIQLSYLNELRNAGFRYALVRLRDAGSAIGLYRGEGVERNLLMSRLTAVMDNYRDWLRRTMLFVGWNFSVSQAINPLPYLVQAQRLFNGQITLGGVMQSATAFAVIHDSLSFFRNAYDSFASYRAAIIRLDGLLDQNSRARAMARLDVTSSHARTLEVDAVEIRRPDGDSLLRDVTFALDPGDAMLISGKSGVGKTVLLQSLAGLWPFVSGRVRLPGERDDVMFVPQLPYMPIGDLRSVVGYPHRDAAVDDRAVQQALVKVSLPHLVIRLNENKDWSKVLSVGEQQRITFARILLAKPRAVFLDESTSAMDEGLELALYQLIRAELPDTIMVSVSHRDTVEQFHGQRLELVGDGGWRLRRSSEIRQDPEAR